MFYLEYMMDKDSNASLSWGIRLVALQVSLLFLAVLPIPDDARCTDLSTPFDHGEV